MPNVYLSGVATLFAAGISLLAAVRVLAVMGSRSEASSDVLRFTALVLIAVGLLGACVVVSGPFGLISWLVVLGIWGRVAMHYRAAQKASLFSALALAVQKQMPLSPMVEAFAVEQEGAFAWRARQFANRLTQGMSLPQAIASSRGLLPRSARLAAQVGLQTGDLSGALQAVSYASVFDRTLLRPLMTRLLYVIPAIVIFAWFMKIRIEPSYVRVLAEYDLVMPALGDYLSLLMDSRAQYSQYTVDYGLEFSFANGSPIVLSVGGFSQITSFFFALSLAIMGLAFYAYLQWRGILMPRLPGWKRIVNWVDMGIVLRLLALAARRELPLSDILNTMAKTYPKRTMRSRLRRVVRDANDGQSWIGSLQRQRLLWPADATILAAAQRSGNLSWALVEMAESFERRAGYRLQAMAQIVLPLLLLPVGAITAVYVIGYFFPLVLMIRALG